MRKLIWFAALLPMSAFAQEDCNSFNECRADTNTNTAAVTVLQGDVAQIQADQIIQDSRLNNQDIRLNDLDSQQAEQDLRLDDLAAWQTEQDLRLDALEAASGGGSVGFVGLIDGAGDPIGLVLGNIDYAEPGASSDTLLVAVKHPERPDPVVMRFDPSNRPTGEDNPLGIEFKGPHYVGSSCTGPAYVRQSVFGQRQLFFFRATIISFGFEC